METEKNDWKRRNSKRIGLLQKRDKKHSIGSLYDSVNKKIPKHIDVFRAKAPKVLSINKNSKDVYKYFFDIIEEIKRRKYKEVFFFNLEEVEVKCYSLKEWKSDHVMKKYENVTVRSLIDFHRYLVRKLENQVDKDSAASGFVYPVLIMIMGLWVTYSADIIKDKTLGLVLSALFILLMSRKIINESVHNDIAKKNLYRDYIETIGELIQIKEKQVDQDGAEAR
jgi:hypothetical protein